MILIVAIATTAIFYNHFEVNMHTKIEAFRSVLAWIHLLGMNIGGATVTLTIAYAGLVGSDVIGTILRGGNITELKPNTQILEQFIIPIYIRGGISDRFDCRWPNFSSKLHRPQEKGYQPCYEIIYNWPENK